MTHSTWPDAVTTQYGINTVSEIDGPFTRDVFLDLLSQFEDSNGAVVELICISPTVYVDIFVNWNSAVDAIFPRPTSTALPEPFQACGYHWRVEDAPGRLVSLHAQKMGTEPSKTMTEIEAFVLGQTDGRNSLQSEFGYHPEASLTCYRNFPEERLADYYRGFKTGYHDPALLDCTMEPAIAAYSAGCADGHACQKAGTGYRASEILATRPEIKQDYYRDYLRGFHVGYTAPAEPQQAPPKPQYVPSTASELADLLRWANRVEPGITKQVDGGYRVTGEGFDVIAGNLITALDAAQKALA